MTETTAHLLLGLLRELATRTEQAHAKLAAMEITLQQYQPDMSAAYSHTLQEIRNSHMPFSVSPATFEDLRKALLLRG
jgi:hypothetical protein